MMPHFSQGLLFRGPTHLAQVSFLMKADQVADSFCNYTCTNVHCFPTTSCSNLLNKVSWFNMRFTFLLSSLTWSKLLAYGALIRRLLILLVFLVFLLPLLCSLSGSTWCHMYSYEDFTMPFLLDMISQYYIGIMRKIYFSWLLFF